LKYRPKRVDDGQEPLAVNLASRPGHMRGSKNAAIADKTQAIGYQSLLIIKAGIPRYPAIQAIVGYL